MKLRVAKKLVRYDYAYDRRQRRYKGPSQWLAHRRLAVLRWRYWDDPLTAGYRWGRWDPHMPQDPNDPPF